MEILKNKVLMPLSMHRIKLATTLIALLSMLTFPAFAAVAGKLDLSSHAQGSELVFLGTIVDIQYAQSGQNRDDVPHTFVTYQVEKIFRGAIDEASAMQASYKPGTTVTLRFLGGIREKDGAVMRVSTIPRFDIDDRDILFVRGNGIANCPLTEFSKGRLRVIDNTLYSEDGQEIIRESALQYGFGKKHQFSQVKSQNIAGKIYTRRSDATFNENGPGESDADSLSQAMSLQEFNNDFQLIDSVSELRPVLSADPKSPFQGPKTVAVADRGETL